MLIRLLLTLSMLMPAQVFAAEPTRSELDQLSVAAATSMVSALAYQSVDLPVMMAFAGIDKESIHQIVADQGEYKNAKVELKSNQYFVDDKASGVFISSYRPFKLKYESHEWTYDKARTAGENYFSLKKILIPKTNALIDLALPSAQAAEKMPSILKYVIPVAILGTSLMFGSPVIAAVGLVVFVVMATNALGDENGKRISARLMEPGKSHFVCDNLNLSLVMNDPADQAAISMHPYKKILSNGIAGYDGNVTNSSGVGGLTLAALPKDVLNFLKAKAPSCKSQKDADAMTAEFTKGQKSSDDYMATTPPPPSFTKRTSLPAVSGFKIWSNGKPVSNPDDSSDVDSGTATHGTR